MQSVTASTSVFGRVLETVSTLFSSSSSTSPQPLKALVHVLEPISSQSNQCLDAADKIKKLVVDNAPSLAGEELLLFLVCTHVVSPTTTNLIHTLCAIAPHFFKGPHEALYDSIYGDLAWFTTIENRLNDSTDLVSQLIAVIEEVIPKGKQGLYTQRRPTTTPLCRLTQKLTRFHDWYALCSHLASLINEQMLIQGLLDSVQKMAKTDTTQLKNLLSLFSILDIIASGGVSEDMWSIISQPDMSLQKWQSTRYFTFFCLKILLYFPTYSTTANILQGLCYFAPYCLHEHAYTLPESPFAPSKSDIIEICYQTVAAKHQKPFTLREFRTHTRTFVSGIAPTRYLQLSVEACSTMPTNLVYNLAVLSALQAHTTQPTIEEWKGTDFFLQFCAEFLQTIEDPQFFIQVFTVFHDSKLDIVKWIQPRPTDSLKNYKEPCTQYLQGCSRSDVILHFLQILKQKRVDIDFLLAKISEDQFKHLSEMAEHEATLFFPGLLQNALIPPKVLFRIFYNGLCLLLGTQVPQSFIEKSLYELAHFRTKNLENQKPNLSQRPINEALSPDPLFDDHVRVLLSTTWSLTLEHVSVPPTLYTGEDIRKKIAPLIAKAGELAPNIKAFIHKVFVEKIIDFLHSFTTALKPQHLDDSLHMLGHIHTHFYPEILSLLNAFDPAERQNPLQRLSYTFFYPLVFPQEFSIAVVHATSVTYTDIIEKTINDRIQLLIKLTSSLIEEGCRGLHEDLVRQKIIESFVGEIKAIAETPRKERYDETACVERIAAKNALLTLIKELFALVQDKDIKRLCFQQIGKLKSQEHQISPEPSPREFLIEPSSTEHRHSFSIKKTGFKIIFEISR